MKTLAISMLTVCGIDELSVHKAGLVTHVLSVLDPDLPEIEAFQNYGAHHRTTLRFHDIIDPQTGMIHPTPEHVGAILRFGSDLASSSGDRQDGHLLVHCHMGVSRSTAAMLALLAQVDPSEDEDVLFARLRQIRPGAWPTRAWSDMPIIFWAAKAAWCRRCANITACSLNVSRSFTIG